MILTLAMAALQKQMWGHRPQHSHTQLDNNYTGPHTYWSNEPSAWHAVSWGSPYQQSYLPVLTVGQWQLADSNNCTTMQFNHNYQPGTNTLYGPQISSIGEATLRQFFESQWLASQVIMTLVSEQSQPRRASHSKQWHPLGQQTKFTAHWVIHGNDHPTHTLHPDPRDCICSSSPGKTGSTTCFSFYH